MVHIHLHKDLWGREGKESPSMPRANSPDVGKLLYSAHPSLLCISNCLCRGEHPTQGRVQHHSRLIISTSQSAKSSVLDLAWPVTVP